MKKLIFLVGFLFFSNNVFGENMILKCKVIGEDKTYTYSIEDDFIYFGLSEYKIVSINEIRIRAEKENLENEYGYIVIDRVEGTMEHIHGLGGKSESVMKSNVIFLYYLDCLRVDKKF